ncbi:MAG: UvrD-helicase domain-containing protein [Acidobacteria bacterium]|nr:UvrD-helicase domain-containing protein [Acidobacteriota bacterium]
MDILSQLNPEQQRAVKHGAGPALVLAGAGSGKTRVIAYRIAYLIRNAAARPETILAVTFTNKAAAEMRQRVQQILGPSRSAEPLISTFHSFCVRLLRKEIHQLGYRRDFSIYDTDDQKRLVKNILNETGLGTERTPREILSRISFAKNHGTPPERYAERFPWEDSRDVQQVYTHYNRRLQSTHSLDFDDLLLKAAEVLRKVPGLANDWSDRYRYILVDEYQDTNRPQYDLLRLLTSRHRNLFVVGDEDQSIYKFRGADIQNILRFEKDFPGAKTIKLEQNYRSSQNILSAAGAVVQNNTERKGKILWTDNGSGDVITCYSAGSAREEAAWIAERMGDILLREPGGHSAILYRTNFLSRSFEDVLTDAGIPYAVVGSVAFFQRMEVKDLLAYLRILFNPEDDVALLRIINTPPRGIGKASVDMLTEIALETDVPILRVLREKSHDPGLPARTARALHRFQDLLDKWNGLKDTGSIARILDAVLKDVQYEQMIRRMETASEAENRLANIEELMRAAGESEQRGESISEFLDRASLSSELDHLDPDARVSLMTLHSAKGLEFDTVFLAALEEGLFPHSHSLNSPEDLEEERRLCYVGITRARKKLFLTWTPFRKHFGPDAGMPARISRFVSEMPPELLQRTGIDALGLYGAKPRASNSFLEWGKRTAARDAPAIGRTAARKGPEVQPKSIAELKAYLEKQQKNSAGLAATTPEAKAIKAGTRVRHDRFGDGIVLSRERSGGDVKLVVSFSRVGRKSLIERYAKLKVL